MSLDVVTQRAIELGTVGMIEQHEEEMRAFLNGDVPANQWRPEKYAEAVVRAISEEIYMAMKADA